MKSCHLCILMSFQLYKCRYWHLQNSLVAPPTKWQGNLTCGLHRAKLQPCFCKFIVDSHLLHLALSPMERYERDPSAKSLKYFIDVFCLLALDMKVMNAWLWCWIGVIGILFVWRTSQMLLPQRKKINNNALPSSVSGNEFSVAWLRPRELRYLVIWSWCT